MKSTEQRLEECIEIKTKLQKLGATISDNARKRISRAMNDFIRTGEPNSFHVRLDDNSNIRVTLTPTLSKQSGIVLERM